MFTSRHTIAISIIILYFFPLLFLSIYGMNGMSPERLWSFFSFGLFFGIAGSLILFSFMIHFETTINDIKEEESLESSTDPLSLEEAPNIDFDAIIVNLNEELELKKDEIQILAEKNSALKEQLYQLEQKNQIPTESDFLTKGITTTVFETHNFKSDHEEFPADSIEAIKPLKENRVEVTKL